LHILSALSGIDGHTIEKSCPIPPHPRKFEPIPYVIARSREDSIREEQNTRTDVKIYSDSSGFKGGVGAAAVMFQVGQNTPTALRYHLGSSENHGTYEVEIVGDLLSIKLAEAVPPNKSIAIFTDNQSVLQASKYPSTNSGKQLLQELNWAYAKLRNRGGRQRQCISFKWISAHSGVEGNESADKEAKEAVKGSSSSRASLPNYLRKPLPRSRTAVKCSLQQEIKDKWKELRRNSPQHARMQCVDPNFKPGQFQKLMTDLGRRHTNILNQLRSNHAPTNSYLCRIRKTDSPTCAKCQARHETIFHYLLECSAYRAERHRAFADLGSCPCRLIVMYTVKYRCAR
jgi:ribonuclease HI